MKLMRYVALGAALLACCGGCAHSGTERPETSESGDPRRVRNTLITVGAAIAIGAILANRAENNTRDIVGDAIPD